jgi:hypothetical protein
MTGKPIFIWLKKMANPFGLATALGAIGADLFSDNCHQTGTGHGLVNDSVR